MLRPVDYCELCSRKRVFEYASVGGIMPIIIILIAFIGRLLHILGDFAGLRFGNRALLPLVGFTIFTGGE